MPKQWGFEEYETGDSNVVPGPAGWAEKAQPEFDPFSPVHWQGRRPDPYDWLVEGCFLRGTVAILSGDGGLGKSLLMQQLMTASAVGEKWLGMETKRVRSLAVFCEDDTEELHRRQDKINAYYDCCYDDLDAMRLESRVGLESVLIKFRHWGGDGTLTPLYESIWRAAVAQRAQIVVLDTLADVYDGNEIDRNQPRVFVRALRRLAIAIQGVVILTQHPSVAGMASGSGMSGSTGWNNSVRSRLYLTQPKKKGEEDAPPNERMLKTMKSNHSATGGKIKLRWSNGVFVREETPLAWYNQPED